MKTGTTKIRVFSGSMMPKAGDGQEQVDLQQRQNCGGQNLSKEAGTGGAVAFPARELQRL